MPLSVEEARLKGIADLLAGNDLSSVFIEHNSKSTNYGVKVYNADPEQANKTAQRIYDELKEKYK